MQTEQFLKIKLDFFWRLSKFIKIEVQTKCVVNEKKAKKVST